MTPRTQRWIAWSGVALAIVAAATAVVLVPVAATTKQIVVGTTNPVFAVAGAVIVARRPGNVVGLLLVGAGVGLAVTEAFGAYAIDRIISRTATYALVSVALVVVYVVVAVVPSAALELESDLLVATATLLAAAVFLPLRTRIQVLVDRRFDRARYDAARIVDGFGARVRGKVDAEAVLDELRTTVAAAVRRTGASVWLAGRQPTR